MFLSSLLFVALALEVATANLPPSVTVAKPIPRIGLPRGEAPRCVSGAPVIPGNGPLLVPPTEKR